MEASAMGLWKPRALFDLKFHFVQDTRAINFVATFRAIQNNNTKIHKKEDECSLI
jgi:hypothetical protein